MINCYACYYSGQDSIDALLVCGHKDAGLFGQTVHPRWGGGHCVRPSFAGLVALKFKQHPLRNPDGTLKP